MIKNSICVSLYEAVIPLPVLIFLNEVLSLYFQIVPLLQISRKIFLTKKIKLFDRLYLGIALKKYAQTQHFWLFLIKEAIKNFF